MSVGALEMLTSMPGPGCWLMKVIQPEGEGGHCRVQSALALPFPLLLASGSSLTSCPELVRSFCVKRPLPFNLSKLAC